MARLPKEWRVYGRGDPDGEVRRSKALVEHHKTPETRLRLIRHVRRSLPQIVLWGLIVVGFGAIGLRMQNLDPLHPSTWPVEIEAKHRVAGLSCEAAHVVGLAPSFRGYPGYWRHLDRDNDGIACETTLFGLIRMSLRTFLGIH